MMPKKYLMFLLTTCFLVSCNEQEKVVNYYPNGQIKNEYYIENSLKMDKYKEFYENGNPKTVYFYEKGKRKDSSVHYFETSRGAMKAIKYWKDDNAYFQKDFFENGRLMRKGKLLKDNFRLGKWDLYALENYKAEVIEYFNINNKSYRNQTWKLNRKGDTILGGNFYRLLHFQDTVHYNQPSRTHFLLMQKLLDGELFLCLPKKAKSLKADFSNEYEITWDTIKNISREFKNEPKYKNVKYDVIFGLISGDKGPNNLRGYLLELEDVRYSDTIDFITRKIYFDIPYYVKE
jgi:antitoxin component YwqK of YwqJK toxin-antitoxin module